MRRPAQNAPPSTTGSPITATDPTPAIGDTLARASTASGGDAWNTVATLDGVAGQFWLDTGNRNALTLSPEFVATHDLARRYGASAETTIGRGMGGHANGRVARGGAFAPGDVTLTAPVLTLRSAGEGMADIRDIAGNIGGDLLRRFVVSFDYGRRLVHLAPNASRHDAFEHDRAGLWTTHRPTASS